ncbi:hypothetical protein JCM9279_003796 [Rhodotorula babjevae]
MIPGGSTPGTSTLIGVGIAILANCLVCAALNLQRLAHLRRARKTDRPASSSKKNRGRSPARPRPPHERTPLIVTTKPTLDRSLSDPLAGSTTPIVLVPSHLRTDSPPPLLNRRSSSRRSSAGDNKRPRTDKGFLRSPLWLAGFACLNFGELGNFLAYGFAAPSVVAPLGMVALIANVFLAPLIVREPFRRKDLVGVAIALVGGATVVYASRSNDQKPTPDEFLSAISRPLFIAYACASAVTMAVLAHLSRTKLGDRYVLIDLSLCALAGAFTVLSTKAVSSFLNLLFLRIFEYWITYPVLVVLVGTALLQVNYVNKSLQRFESRVVIPTQFMTFALSTIVGSAILYRDFEGVALPSLVNFAFGCLVSALGVYLLTRDPPAQSPSSGTKPGSSSADAAPSPSPYAALSARAPPSLSHHAPTSPSSPRLLPVPLVAAALSPGLSRSRTLSLTLGGGYLLAGSPGALGVTQPEPAHDHRTATHEDYAATLDGLTHGEDEGVNEVDLHTPAHEGLAHAWLKRFIPGIEKVAASYGLGNYVVTRGPDAVKVWESMPLYVRVGMQALYHGREQAKLLESRRVEELFKQQSIKQGRAFDSPVNALPHIEHFVSTYRIETASLLEPDLTKYRTFNEFFYRRLKPDARPPASPDDPDVVSSAADCRLTVFETVDAAKELWIKGKHFTIPALLDDDELAAQFDNAALAVFRLAPADYHRYHSPVTGTVGSTRSIEGEYYTVNPVCVNEAEVDVFTQNKRDVTLLSAPRPNGSVIPVAYVQVGAMLVGAIKRTVQEGDEVKRAAALGYFGELGFLSFPGSTIIAVFPQGSVKFDDDLLKNSRERIETVVRAGEQIGRFV